MARVWLDVPFAEKDEAKALGARWDPAAKRWFAPRAGLPGLDRWVALPDLPPLLPGEDRGFGSGLFVDLVPRSCWFTNVRSCVAPRDWERLRRMVNGRAGQRCEVCGRGEDRGRRRWLEAHERWEYDEARAVQRLRRLVCLCTDCHTVTHFGLAELNGRRAAALAHLRSVTGMSAAGAESHVRSAFALWRERSARVWELDLHMLTGAGVTVVAPPPAVERERTAWRTARGQRAAPPAAPPALARPAASWPAVPEGASAPAVSGKEPVREGPAVSEEELACALETVFARPSPKGGPQWIAVPRWQWLCHMCDTRTGPPDIAIASVSRTSSGRRQIVCRPCEWAHHVDGFELAEPVRRAVLAAADAALHTPGSAATWDPRTRRFHTVSGQLSDGRPPRGRLL
ncbi:DUF5710 domain-containing protein [Streptomyces sp. RK75]|uniref:DUF5710 domain-containing protein n=1 Tax=Streptomyces sp. RK75 TaxID=2824895 RepID=UPI001B37F5C9|nr:DUF5710 domain-containing protein [Streptomyces sp. RK75]MBQ0867447.1 hypothetical protein [Streptomyces sp. RK75]